MIPGPIVRRIYLFSFLDDFMVVYPLYSLMFEDHGLDTAQISALLFIWSATSILFEVPSGALADRIDRRKLLAVGEVLRAVGYTLWLVWPSFWGFAAGFVLWGVQGALTSGTFEAFVYDELRSSGRSGLYARVLSRCEGMSLVGVLSATLIAAPIVSSGYDAPLLLSIAASLLAASVVATLPKAADVMSTAGAHYFATLRNGVRAAGAHKTIRSAVVISALTAAAYGALEEYSPLFVSDIGFALTQIPVVLATMGAVTAFAAFVAYRAEKLPVWCMLTGLLVASGLLVVASLMATQVAVVPFVAYFFLSQALSVVASARLQHAVDVDERATVTSVANVATEVLTLAIFTIFGIASYWGRSEAFLAMGALIATLTLVMLVARTMRRVATSPVP